MRDEILGYRLEWKAGDYCYYTPEQYAREEYKDGAQIHGLYAAPQPGCSPAVEVHKGWCWVRPKHNFGNLVDETFEDLYLGPSIHPDNKDGGANG